MPRKTVRFKNKSGDWRSKKLDRWEKAYQIQQKRSKRAISIDNSRNANRFMNPANDKLSDKELRTYNSWVKNPARSDLVGIDTKTSVVGKNETKIITKPSKIGGFTKKIAEQEETLSKVGRGKLQFFNKKDQEDYFKSELKRVKEIEDREERYLEAQKVRDAMNKLKIEQELSNLDNSLFFVQKNIDDQKAREKLNQDTFNEYSAVIGRAKYNPNNAFETLMSARSKINDDSSLTKHQKDQLREKIDDQNKQMINDQKFMEKRTNELNTRKEQEKAKKMKLTKEQEKVLQDLEDTFNISKQLGITDPIHAQVINKLGFDMEKNSKRDNEIVIAILRKREEEFWNKSGTMEGRTKAEQLQHRQLKRTIDGASNEYNIKKIPLSLLAEFDLKKRYDLVGNNSKNQSKPKTKRTPKKGKDYRLQELETNLQNLKKEDPKSFGSKSNYDLAIGKTEREIYIRKGKMLEENYEKKIKETTTKTQLNRLRTKLSKDKEVQKYTDQKTQVLANIGDKIRKKSRVMNK